ncbi:WxL domain-containing protein, partial [Enterococcus faecalis]
GVTAVAETVTIESSPTAESSAKEETQASSVKEETTKASTENSQVTTDTSQEEETKEAEKQAETEVKEEQKEEPQAEVEQAETPANSSENDLQKGISPRWVPNNQSIYPRMTFGFTDETGKAFADETLTLSGTYYKLARHIETNQWRAYADRYPIVSSNAGGGQYRVAVNAAISVPYDFLTNLPAGYDVNIYAIEQLKIDNTLKYVDSIVAPVGTISRALYSKQQVSETPKFGNYSSISLTQRDRTFSKSSTNIFSLNSKALATNVLDVLTILRTDATGSAPGIDLLLVGFDGTPTYRQTLNYKVTRKQVTEKFVNTSGVAITPPTGFTQNKKTPMTSNAFTFKQAGTLPDTYTTGGKTYKFKGWYKGKSILNTLTNTKAPSYQVTYDDNDDLNVVYEEETVTTFYPSINLNFVNEKGGAFTPALTFSGKYNVQRASDKVITNLYDLTSKSNGNGQYTVSINNGSVPLSHELLKKYNNGSPISTTNSLSFKLDKLAIDQQLKYVDSIRVEAAQSSGLNTYRYDYTHDGSTVIDSSKAPIAINMSTAEINGLNFTTDGTNFSNTNNRFLGMRVGHSVSSTGSNYLFNTDLFSNNPANGAKLVYKVTRKQVTENFVDANGAKITAPTGFTQGNQVPMNSNTFKYTAAKALPATYTAGGKVYTFQGWYKGKTKPSTLNKTTTPTFNTTFDGNDDMTAMYKEETITTFYPSVNMNFVNEKGGAFTPALTFSGKYYAQSTSASLRTDLYDVTSKNNGSGQYTVSINNGSMSLSHELLKKYNNGNPISTTNRLRFKLDKLAIDQQLKYVDSIQVETAQSSGLNVYSYEYRSDLSTVIDSNKAPIPSSISTTDINGLNFKTDGTNFSNVDGRFLGMLVGHSLSSSDARYYRFVTELFSNNSTNDAKLVYKVTRKQVTENFVDANGAKITAPTGFTQGNQVPMNSNTFKYTAAKALPATYTAGGKTYTFQGWYKGKTKPSTLNKTTTPTFNATFDGNDDMTAMYKEEIPMASVTLTRPKEVIDTNTNVIWTTTITNTSKAPLQNLTLKKGPNWSAGLTIPTFMEVTPEGETTKSIPVNSTLWTDGVSLPNAVPIGKKVSIAFTTRATGKPNTVLKAEVVVFGGIKDSAVDNFVRILPNDQEVVTPTTEGFISVPTFDFGQVGVAGSKQQHSLKKAADYYGNGTRNPYVRIKKTQPNWSLTAQLSQPKSATDNLPTATRLLLGAAPVSSFTNYNQPTELKNAVGTTSAISLTANNTATSIIANKQFTGSNVYQLDFTFNNVKLEVPANQGVKGQQYKAAVTWNLVTGP